MYNIYKQYNKNYVDILSANYNGWKLRETDNTSKTRKWLYLAKIKYLLSSNVNFSMYKSYKKQFWYRRCTYYKKQFKIREFIDIDSLLWQLASQSTINSTAKVHL